MNEPRHHPSPSRSDEAIDEFESIFKRAERTPYRFADISLESIAIVTDADQQAADTLIVDLKRFLPQIAKKMSMKVRGTNFIGYFFSEILCLGI